MSGNTYCSSRSLAAKSQHPKILTGSEEAIGEYDPILSLGYMVSYFLLRTNKTGALCEHVQVYEYDNTYIRTL